MVKVSKVNWFLVEPGSIYSTCVHPDSTRVAFAIENRVVIVGVPELSAQLSVESSISQTTASGYTFNSRHFRYDESILSRISYHSNNVNIVRFSTCGKYLASGSDDKSISIHELVTETQKDSNPKNAPNDDSDGIVWDAPAVAFGGGTTTEKWSFVVALRDFSSEVLGLCFSPHYLIATCIALRVVIYSATAPFKLLKVVNLASIGKGLCVCPVERYIYIDGDKSITSLDIRDDFKVLKVIKKTSSSELQSCRPSCSPDGSYVLGTNTIDGHRYCVPLYTRSPLKVAKLLHGHRSDVKCSSFSPCLYRTRSDSSKKGSTPEDLKDVDVLEVKNMEKDVLQSVFVTCDLDSRLVVWGSRHKRPLLVLARVLKDKIVDVEWSPDGYTFFVGCVDGSILMVKLDEKEIGTKVDDLGKRVGSKFGQDLKVLEFPPYDYSKITKRVVDMTKIKPSRKRRGGPTSDTGKKKSSSSSLSSSSSSVLVSATGEADEENDKKRRKTSLRDSGVSYTYVSTTGICSIQGGVDVYISRAPKYVNRSDKYIAIIDKSLRLNFFCVQTGMSVMPPVMLPYPNVEILSICAERIIVIFSDKFHSMSLFHVTKRVCEVSVVKTFGDGTLPVSVAVTNDGKDIRVVHVSGQVYKYNHSMHALVAYNDVSNSLGSRIAQCENSIVECVQAGNKSQMLGLLMREYTALMDGKVERLKNVVYKVVQMAEMNNVQAKMVVQPVVDVVKDETLKQELSTFLV